ncbi:uncharacterized protein [Asterias amurensis]|uniref:uncharacterized protein n=1 Tax=Asterias amurensis TaxID=7602 RepID=UPI003AB47135
MLMGQSGAVVLTTRGALLFTCYLAAILTVSTSLPTGMPTTTSASESPAIEEFSPISEQLEAGEATELLETSQPDTYQISEYDAKKFLQSYGYMPTYIQSKGKWEFVDRSKMPVDEVTVKTTTPSPVNLRVAAGGDNQKATVTAEVDANSDSLKLEERTKFSEAIQKFQKRYRLRITGSVDDETLRFMQQPRCGVPDNTESFNTKKGLQKGSSTTKIKGKLGLSVGKSTLKATINNDSGRLSGSKSTLVTNGGRTTVSSPSLKLGASRTQDSVLSRSPSKPSEPISVSSLLTRTTKPRATSPPRASTSRGTPQYITEVTEIITDFVTEEDELMTTTRPKTSSLTTVGTPPVTKFDMLRSKRSLEEVLSSIQQNRARVRNKRQYVYDNGSNASNIGFSDVISWRIIDAYYSQHFSSADLRSQIEQAFRRWSEILPLKFEEKPSGDLLLVDIHISFIDSTNSGHFNVDFSSVELARSTSNWAILFNDDIQWTYNSHQGKNLIQVAVHEVGHVLGLTHMNQSDSIMYPVYVNFDPNDSNFRVVIDNQSRHTATSIHGVCSGSFDTVFDWVRTVGTKKKYSSVFFRGDTMWVYENTNGRVKYGDPRAISDMWTGVPNDLDAALQILPRSSTTDDLYFFKGNRYYQFDNINRHVMQLDGRLISEGWPAKSSSFPRIPDNIDTAYFDKRDGNVYFFKGTLVYAYDMEAGGCCLNNYPMSISSAFIFRYEPGGLPSYLNAAYYSIYSKKVFFFKGDTFWENETYSPASSQVVNRLGYGSAWNDHWNNICEV